MKVCELKELLKDLDDGLEVYFKGRKDEMFGDSLYFKKMFKTSHMFEKTKNKDSITIIFK